MEAYKRRSPDFLRASVAEQILLTFPLCRNSDKLPTSFKMHFIPAENVDVCISSFTVQNESKPEEVFMLFSLIPRGLSAAGGGSDD